MRKIALMYLFLISILLAGDKEESDRHDKWSKAGGSWMESWENTFATLNQQPKEDQIRMLGAGVRLGASIFKPEQLSVFKRAQKMLLAIPGHAEFFANEVEILRKNETPCKLGDRPNYDRWREWYFSGTLSNLPSPETVKVLGGYLHDERDVVQQAECGGMLYNNSYLCGNALCKLGLRDMQPSLKPGFIESYNNLQKIRDWYDEVKSGRKTFSFKGQAVEYRFKPDGTWDTIPIANPPDDAIVYKFQQASKDRADIPPATHHPSQAGHWKQPWVWGVGAFVLFFIGIFGWNRKARV